MSAKPKKDKTTQIEIVKTEMSELSFCLLGHSPLLCNAMSSKVRQDLLLPPKKKNTGEKQSTLKHHPLNEYRGSVYMFRDEDKAPTRILHPGSAFRRAMATAALESDGTNKTQVGRLSWVQERDVAIYGAPQLHMSVVRQAGQTRAPDVRTRAILPEWACRVTVEHVMPRLTPTAVINLMAFAGMIIGVGDGRNEKGAFSFGQFRIVKEKDINFQRVCKAGGRKQQDEALANPACFDLEAERLLEWWHGEAVRRGFDLITGEVAVADKRKVVAA